jgi:urea transporter
MFIYYGIPASIVVLIGFLRSFFYLKQTDMLSLGALLPAALLFLIVTEAFSRLLFPVVFIPALYGIALLRLLKRETLRRWLLVGLTVFFVILGWRVQEASLQKTRWQFRRRKSGVQRRTAAPGNRETFRRRNGRCPVRQHLPAGPNAECSICRSCR